ncbi:MAG TPA: sulfate transporter [Candidatus Scalindua sp.]|nr:sulfate transporter [Candidatus Scalindua sp.]
MITERITMLGRDILNNIKGLRFNRHELAGSLGDMGTFIPILVGMVTVCGLNAGSALFFAGFFNLITGIIFGIPLAVQPMKAIGTIAINEGLTVNQILTAGIVTSAVVFLLGITNLIGFLNKHIPLSVIRGLQLGLGLLLIINGVKMVTDTNTIFGLDSIAVGAFCGLLVLFLFFSKRFPGALVVFAIGFVFLFLRSPNVLEGLSYELSIPKFVIPGKDDFISGTLKAAIPQIPLTTLNSVIAVCALSWDLFPKKGADTRKMATSVGLMNLIGCWFGAMPMCHGSGGLAAQYGFGARTGGSIVFLGIIKMVIGFFFGAYAIKLLSVYPLSVLGVLLTFSGLELAMTSRDIKARSDMFVMLLTAAVIIAFHSTAIGFVVGLALAYFFLFGVLRIEKIDKNTNKK